MIERGHVATEKQVTNLPSDGSTLHVTLFSDFSDETLSWATTYTATSVAQNVAAEITTPSPGSKLISGPVDFAWNDGLGATSYTLRVSDSPPTVTYFQQTLPVGTNGVTVLGLPEDGQALLVSLETRFDVGSETRQYAYTAAGGAVGDVVFFRIENPMSGWRHFKLGYGNEHIWAPQVSPAAGQSSLVLQLRGRRNASEVAPEYSKLEILPSSDPSGGVRLGDWIGSDPVGWFSVEIPLSAFPSGAWNNVTHWSLRSADAAPFVLDLERFEFTLGSGAPFVWFGAPEKTDNAFIAGGGPGELLAGLMTEGGDRWPACRTGAAGAGLGAWFGRCDLRLDGT